MDLSNIDLTNLLVWLALGAVAGWLAGLLFKGRGMGLIGNIIVGIIGSFLGGWLSGFLGIQGAQVGGFSWASILTAVGGAIVLLFVLRLLRGR